MELFHTPQWFDAFAREFGMILSKFPDALYIAKNDDDGTNGLTVKTSWF